MSYIFSDEIQSLIDYDDNKLGVTMNRVDMGLAELKQVYAENYPYLELRTTVGTSYIWNEAFIEKCQIAMTTDSLSAMNAQELLIWETYVSYSDAMTSSADDTMNVLGVGCTIPDVNGDSFIVLDDGTITLDLCTPALSTFTNEAVLNSLDTVFMNILNCLPFNTDNTITGDLEDIAPCTI